MVSLENKPYVRFHTDGELPSPSVFFFALLWYNVEWTII
jgi:hypothetical protein